MNTTLVATKIEPYLQFGGRCEEALNFYSKALDGEVQMLMRFKDSPEPCEGGPKMDENQIMHGSIKVGETVLMGTDFGCAEGAEKSGFAGFSLSLSASDEAQAKKYFSALSDGGQVHMPLGKTFFSPCFGVVQDKYGVSWMVIVPGQ